jgi:hypothetical protein
LGTHEERSLPLDAGDSLAIGIRELLDTFVFEFAGRAIEIDAVLGECCKLTGCPGALGGKTDLGAAVITIGLEGDRGQGCR